MAKVDIKGKGKQCQQNESDDEVICLDIDDVSTLLKSKEADDTDEPENHSDLITTPDRKPLRTMEELLKTSPPSPLFCERKKGDAPLPKAPVFVIDDSDEEDTKPKKSNKPNKPSVLRDDLDLDLDASVAAIFRPKKGGVKRKKKPDVARSTNMECPICSRLFPKELIEIHAANCTGAYSESEEEDSQGYGKKKKTMASGIAKSESIRKKKFKNVEQVKINYYSQSEEMVGTDGGDFASSSSGLNWESAGQTRFA